MRRLDDPARLEALTRSGLLHKDTVTRLDHLAFAACRLLLADVCLINALDGALQRTVVGYPPGDDWPPLPLELTGCREIVLSGKPFVVSDALSHPITCELPWAGSFRGYLGCPVVYDGEIIGSICVLSAAPRSWKPYEITALEGVARLAGMSLEDAVAR